jgi:hypothetical protein
LLRRLFVLVATAPVIAAGALALGGCPADPTAEPPDAAPAIPETSCPTGYLGDPSKDMQIELRALRADGTDVALNDGDDLAVIFPPQGGRVAFVGVRATNLDGCGVQVTGALRDPLSKQLRLDGRTVNLRREDDGFGTTGEGASTDLEDSSAIGNYSNVPLCPNQWADQDVFDQVFELEVRVQDVHGKKGGATIHVTPRCAEPGAKETSCRCLCKKGYVLGESCGEDAGTDASTDGGAS